MPIFTAILAVFIIVPLIEIGLFIKVGGAIGMWWTLAIVGATAVGGAALLRQQGRSTLRRAREQMARNTLPLAEAFDGVMLVVAGALLLTPGFMTDALGGLLLTPLARRLVRKFVIGRIFMAAGIDMGGQAGGSTIDGEFRPADEPGGDDRTRNPPTAQS